MLPTFDLSQAIRDLKATDPEEAHRTEHDEFGFVYLKPAQLAAVNGAIAYVNQGVDNTFVTTEEQAYLPKQQAVLAQQRQRLKAREPKRTQPIPRIPNPALSAQLQAKSQYLAWLKTHQAWFSTPAVWCVEEPHGQPDVLSQLKNAWQQQAFFAAHTLEALREATVLLPSLIRYHEQVHAAAKQHWFPKPIAQAYRTYLNTFHQQARALRRQLIAALLARLETHAGGFAHVLDAFGVSYQRAGGTLPATFHIRSRFHETMASQQLLAFHAFVLRWGDSDAERRLQALPWFSKQARCPLTFIPMANQTIQLVPQALVHLVPKKPRWPVWLFPGHTLRHTFFQDKTALLVSLQTSHRVSRIALDEAALTRLNQAMQRWVAQTQQLSHALADVREEASQFPRWWYRTEHRLLDAWQQQLTDALTSVHESQCQAAEALLSALEEASSDDLHAAITYWPAVQQLQALLKNLMHETKSHGVSPLIRERMTSLNQKTAHLFAHHRGFQALYQLAQGQVVEETELTYLKDHLEGLSAQSIEAKAAFLTCSEQAIAQGLARCLASLKACRTPPILESTFLFIEHAYGLLTLVTTPEQQAHLHRGIERLFLHYLVTVAEAANYQSHLAAPHLERLEALLMQVGTTVKQGGIPIPTLVTECQALRQAGKRRRLQCRAQALAEGLTNQRLTHQVAKDMRTLEAALPHVLDENPTVLHAEGTHVTVLTQHCQQAATHKIGLGQLPLSSAERVLMGLAGEHPERLPVFEATVSAYQTKTLLERQAPLVDKVQALNRMHTTLQQATHGLTVAGLFQSKRGRPLFQQTYVAPALLAKKQALPSH